MRKNAHDIQYTQNGQLNFLVSKTADCLYRWTNNRLGNEYKKFLVQSQENKLYTLAETIGHVFMFNLS